MSKIVFFLWAHDDFGGCERRYLRLADHLASSGHSIAVTCSSESISHARNYYKGEIISLFKFHTIFGKRNRFLNRCFEFIALNLKTIYFKANHVHICANPTLSSASTAIIMRLFGVKTSLAMVDSCFLNNRSRIYIQFVSLLALLPAQRVDCLSIGTFKILADLTPSLFHNKLKIAPCSYSDPTKAWISDSKIIDILMMCRFIDYKGLDCLERIDEALSSYEVHVCGFGPRAYSGKNAKVYRASDPFAVMANAKIFLSLQSYENYPSQSLLEAIFSGCAIIATDVGGTRDFLGDCAIYVKPSDSSSLLDAIHYLLHNQTVREQMTSKLRDRVSCTHTIQNYASYFSNSILN